MSYSEICSNQRFEIDILLHMLEIFIDAPLELYPFQKEQLVRIMDKYARKNCNNMDMLEYWEELIPCNDDIDLEYEYINIGFEKTTTRFKQITKTFIAICKILNK